MRQLHVHDDKNSRRLPVDGERTPIWRTATFNQDPSNTSSLIEEFPVGWMDASYLPPQPPPFPLPEVLRILPLERHPKTARSERSCLLVHNVSLSDGWRRGCNFKYYRIVCLSSSRRARRTFYIYIKRNKSRILSGS